MGFQKLPTTRLGPNFFQRSFHQSAARSFFLLLLQGVHTRSARESCTLALLLSAIIIHHTYIYDDMTIIVYSSGPWHVVELTLSDHNHAVQPTR